MATISNPKVRSSGFLTVDDVKTLFETTRTSVDTLSDLESSTEVSSGSSLWQSSEVDDSDGETSTVQSGTSPSLSDDESVMNLESNTEVIDRAEDKVTSSYFLRPREAGKAKRAAIGELPSSKRARLDLPKELDTFTENNSDRDNDQESGDRADENDHGNQSTCGRQGTRGHQRTRGCQKTRGCQSTHGYQSASKSNSHGKDASKDTDLSPLAKSIEITDIILKSL